MENEEQMNYTPKETVVRVQTFVAQTRDCLYGAFGGLHSQEVMKRKLRDSDVAEASGEMNIVVTSPTKSEDQQPGGVARS